MKKPIAAVAAVALGAGLALVGVVTPATATPTIPAEFCEAVYETQPNPDHVAAVEEVSHIVHHDAVTETIHHEAIYRTEWKYSKHGGPGFAWVDNDEFKYVKDGVGTDEKPRHGTFYERTQNTRQVEVTAAWDETIEVTAAWDETVIDTPASDAIGEPTIEVYKGDWCEGWFTSSTTFLTLNPQNADDVSWPQTILGSGKIAPDCDVQVQQDYWAGWREQIEAILADGILSRTNGIPEDSQVVKEWTFVDGGDCPVIEEPQPEYVTPLPPTFDDFCGTKDDAVNIPADTEDSWYESFDNRVDGVGEVTVTQHLNEGFIFPRDAISTWIHVFSDEACPITEEPEEPVTPVTTTNTGTLANTGLDAGPSWALIAALLALVAGGSIGAYRLSKRSN